MKLLTISWSLFIPVPFTSHLPRLASWFLKDKSGELLIPFGGTSGAAPLVTSALSKVKSVLPNINYKNLKIYF